MQELNLKIYQEGSSEDKTEQICELEDKAVGLTKTGQSKEREF